MQSRRTCKALLVVGLFCAAEFVSARGLDQPCMDICNLQTPCDQACDGLGSGATNCGEFGTCLPPDDQCVPLWWDEVSRTEMGVKNEADYMPPFGLGYDCYRYWRVTARDIRCGWPDRDFCDKEIISEEPCGGAAWGESCQDASMQCFRGHDCW